MHRVSGLVNKQSIISKDLDPSGVSNCVSGLLMPQESKQTIISKDRDPLELASVSLAF